MPNGDGDEFQAARTVRERATSTLTSSPKPMPDALPLDRTSSSEEHWPYDKSKAPRLAESRPWSSPPLPGACRARSASRNRRPRADLRQSDVVRGNGKLLPAVRGWTARDLRVRNTGASLRARDRNRTTSTRGVARWNRSAPARSSPTGGLVRLGVVAGDTGWYAERGGRLTRLPIPPKALPRWAANGSSLAYFVPGETTIALGPTRWRRRRSSSMAPSTDSAGRPRAMPCTRSCCTPTVCLRSKESLLDGTVTVVRANLDASPFFNSIAFSGGRRHGVPRACERRGARRRAASRSRGPAPRPRYLCARHAQQSASRAVPRTGDDCCPYVAAGISTGLTTIRRGGRRVSAGGRRPARGGRPWIPAAMEPRRTSNRVHSRLSPARGLRPRHGRLGRWR